MGVEAASISTPAPAPAPSLNRPLLQPTCNPPPTSLHRYDQPSISLNNKPSLIKSPPPSPNSKSPRPPAIKRPGITTQTNTMNMINANSSSDQKILTDNNNIRKNLIDTSPPLPVKSASALQRIKKSKSFKEGEASLTYSSSLILEAPGSIAAVRREQMALKNAQRKMRIAHYGRSKSAKFDSKVFPLSLVVVDTTTTTTASSDDHRHHQENKRCSFITPNTDPVYVAYHDEEWGVPVHDDNMLFELLVLSGAQVGSDWTSILKKRQDFRDAFSGFDAETVSNFTEKQMMSISTHYNIDISRIRGVVDNSNRILEVKKEFGSLNKYIWGFVNHKAISTNYKFGHKMAVKTSKSESISKDMVRRGFRFVGPTVVHSFMQAAGLTNDHLITCHRHLPCTLLAARRPINCQ